MSEKSTRSKDETRNDIVEASYLLFTRQGYHGTSMRQIAKGARLALGGLYNHFDSKEEIFRAVFLDCHPYHQVLPPILEAQGNTAEKIVRDALEKMSAAIKNQPDFINLMFIEIVEFDSKHANELFEILLPQEMEIFQRVMETQYDRIRPIPPLMLLRSFFGLFFSYILTDVMFASRAPKEMNDNALEYFIDIYLHGILID